MVLELRGLASLKFGVSLVGMSLLARRLRRTGTASRLDEVVPMEKYSVGIDEGGLVNSHF